MIAPAARAERARGERHQRERAAFAFVVGAQQDEHVFGGDDEQQRPDDQRQDAEHDRLRSPARRRPIAASTDSRSA